MDLFTSKALGLLVIPPGILLVVAMLGFLIQIKWVWAGNILVMLAVAALLVLSLPYTGHLLLRNLESRYPPLPSLEAARKQGEAIVVLGGGRYNNAPEYDGKDTITPTTLARLRYAARLHRATGLPILVTGGAVFGEKTGEAELMRDVLVNDFGVEVRWIETKSRTTWENAVFTQKLLAEASIRRVLLVTHAWHMARADWAFTRNGLIVTPAPMGFTTLDDGDRRGLGYLPAGQGLWHSSLAVREHVGLFWYRSHHDAEPASVPPAAQPAPG